MFRDRYSLSDSSAPLQADEHRSSGECISLACFCSLKLPGKRNQDQKIRLGVKMKVIPAFPAEGALHSWSCSCCYIPARIRKNGIVPSLAIIWNCTPANGVNWNSLSHASSALQGSACPSPSCRDHITHPGRFGWLGVLLLCSPAYCFAIWNGRTCTLHVNFEQCCFCCIHPPFVLGFYQLSNGFDRKNTPGMGSWYQEEGFCIWNYT